MVASLEASVRDLEAALAATAPDLDAARASVTALKIGATRLSAMTSDAAPTEESIRELLVARRVYELALSIAVLTRDMPGFERAVAHAKQFYLDYAAVLPPSSAQPYVLGLNLMRLLAQNRIAELHTELELINTHPTDSAEPGQAFLAYPLELERLVMEGSYAKIASTRQALPHPHFEWFLEMLLHTVRGEIAECTERAYELLPLAYAASVMLLDTPDQLEDWVVDNGRDWSVDREKNVLVLPRNREDKENLASDSLDAVVPVRELIQRSLEYAKELERII